MAHPPATDVTRRRGAAGRIDPPPREVLEGVRRREAAAMTTFFETYFDLVYGVAFRLTGETAAAEDLTQDVFARVHASAGTLDAGRDPAPWLVLVTTNAFRDRWRSVADRIRRASVSFEADPGLRETLPGRQPTPEETMITREREARVQEAIARLPAGLREVVVLHAYLEWGHDRIAAALGATHGAIRKRYSRGLAELAALLEDVV